MTLGELVKSSKSFKSIFNYLAHRPRWRSEPTRISRFKKSLRQAGIPVKLNELYDLFKKLEQLGIGELRYSRKRPLVFIWDGNFRDIAIEALKEAQLAQVVRLRPETKSIVFVMPSGKQVMGSSVNKNTLARRA
jgi:hypothetical protein